VTYYWALFLSATRFHFRIMKDDQLNLRNCIARFSGDKDALCKGINLEFFEASGGVERKLKRLLNKGVLMDVSKLQKALQQNIGHVTFAEAYERTGRIMNISVSPGNSFENPRLLNYLTAPNVLVWFSSPNTHYLQMSRPSSEYLDALRSRYS
jgi:predicted acylesterase/phospholipase RssA